MAWSGQCIQMWKNVIFVRFAVWTYRNEQTSNRTPNTGAVGWPREIPFCHWLQRNTSALCWRCCCCPPFPPVPFHGVHFFLFGSTQFHFGQFEQFWQMKRTVEGGGSFFSRKWNISQRMFLHQFNEHFNTKNLNSMKFSSIERWQLKGWFSFFFFKFKKYNFGFFFEIS